MPSSRRHPAAFTLIELLVVIAIVALLIALLMPALGRSRESARRVQCMSLVKQVAVATQAYHNDHREKFPGWPLLTPVQSLMDFSGGGLSRDAFLCPSGELRPNPKLRSYTANAFLLYRGWSRPADVPRPAATLWMVEENEISIDNEHFAVTTGTWWNMIARRHGGANLSFVDGHVEYWGWEHASTGVFTGYFAPDPGNGDLDRINRAQCPPWVP